MPAFEPIDWRVWKGAQVSEDVQLPDGTQIKKGDGVYVSTITRDSSGVMRTFITPSPVRLALNVAIGAAIEGSTLRPTLWQAAVRGSATPLYDDLPNAFAYFEYCMVAATFSFQSLEAFANEIIRDNQKGSLEVQRRDGVKLWTSDEVERHCSTEEKLADILPRLGAIQSPKGKKPWEAFKKLKGIRDSTIHWKEPDQYVRGREDKDSLYHRFLRHNPKEFPRWAIAMLLHYTAAENNAWIRSAEARLDTRAITRTNEA